jgi:hypothetical protein
MKDLWGPIDASEWHEVPALSGRVATEEDVRRGTAAFFIEGESTPHPMPLPFCAIQTLEDGQRVRVVVIQAEACSGVIVGVRYLNGGNGVCTLEELELKSWDLGK